MNEVGGGDEAWGSTEAHTHTCGWEGGEGRSGESGRGSDGGDGTGVSGFWEGDGACGVHLSPQSEGVRGEVEGVGKIDTYAQNYNGNYKDRFNA